MNKLYAYLPLALGAILISCDSITPSELKPDYAFKPGNFTKDANVTVSDGYFDRPAGLTGAHKIVVNIAMQNAKYYIGNTQVGYTTVSTGRDGKATPRRSYRVLSKDIDHRSSKYGSIVDAQGNVLMASFERGKDRMPAGGRYVGSSMFYGLQLNTTGIWMHEGIVTSAPESAGCIRLPTNMAKAFYENIPIGSLVVVQ